MNGNQRLAMRRLGRRTMTWKAVWLVLAAWLASAAGMLCPVAGAQAVSGTVNVGSFPIAMQLNPVTNKVYVADFTSNTSPNNVIVIDGATNSTTTITTGVGTVAVGVNPVTNKIYVANFNSNDVTVIDGATNTTATVAAGLNPSAVAVNPVTNKIYVANNGSNNVTVIDGATTTTTTVAAGLNPSAVAVNPVTNKIYVANLNSANVTVIDGTTNSATTVSTGNDPVAVAVNPVTNKIYVTNNLSANVTVIDGATNSTTTVSTGGNPDAVAVNPLTNKIYVANNQTANVTVIDGATNSTITVATGEIPETVAVNPLTNKIYVGCGNNSNIVVIDGATNTTTTIAGTQNQVRLLVNPVTNKVYGNNFAFVTVIDGAAITTTLVTVGTNPQSIAANLETNKIYIPNRDSNDVTVIDGATNATATVAAGAQPVAVAVNPVTNSIYVANNGDNTVTVIDGTTNTSTTVASGAAPTAVAVNPVTNKIYVANHNDNTVTVIDGITNSTTTVATGGQPAAVAVNSVTNKVYVANLGNSVTVIDGATNSTTTIPDGDAPAAIAVNPVTNKIYVADSSFNAFGINTVTVIDGATNSTTTIPTGLDPPLSVDVNPITNKIYFANAFDTVTILDGATNTIQTITVGMQPIGVAVNPATNKIYVPNSGDNNVTVIDGATNTTLATISSGFGAQGVTVNPVTNTVYFPTASGGVGKAFVLQEQQAPPIPLQAAITPLPGNITGIFTPTLHFSDSGAFPPLAPPVQAMYMQIDTWQGPWTLAASEGNEQFTATLATPLQPGIHIAYAYADLQDITSANQGTSSTPFVSNITGYAFVVAPPSAGLSPTSLDFGSQPVNTTSLAHTVTLTNANSPLDIGRISVSGHFLESDNCPAQLAAGASCTISVMFAPVFSDQGKTVTGAVTITDDNHGITANTDMIALTGVGSAPVTAPPTITKAFGAASIPLNGSTLLTFTMSNPNSTVTLSGIAFFDTFPAGLIVSASPALNSSCGGTVSAVAGSGTVSLSGGTLAANASCAISVNVTGTTAGTKNNTTTAPTSTEGGTGVASNTASIMVVSPPDFVNATFGAASIPLNGSTSLTFAIQNNNAGTTLTGVGFTDTLPAGLIISTPNGLTGTCGGGTITATQGTNVISLSGATLTASSSCTFTVNVTGTAAGTQNNTTGNVTSTEGGTGGTAAASINVIAPPSIAKVFTPNTIALNATTSLTFTITNPAANPMALTGVAFTDTLPTGLTVANATPAICGGTLTTTAPTGIALTGATIAANGQCQISITVTGAASGNYTNTTGAVTSTNGGTGNTATANLSVTSPPTITKTFGAATIPLNGSTSLSFTITNPVVNAIPLTGVTFTDTLPAGLIVATPNGLTGSCGGGTITATAGSGSVSLTGATLGASASCTFSMNVMGTTAGTKNNSVQVTATESGPGNTSNASIAVVTPPAITKAFGAASIPLNGSTSLTFAIQNNNAGTTLTGVGFTDTLPAGLILSTPNGLTGSCSGGTITATQATNAISLTGASIAASTSCTFSVNVTGSTGGVKNNTTGNVTSTEGGTGGTASASVTVLMPDVTITKTHAGSFTQGQTVGATYTITVSNIGTAPTVGAVSVTDALPAGLTATAIGGTGWTCPTLINCTRSDVLASGSSFPAITLTVSVAINAPAIVINSVTVSGGGETDLTNDTAADTTAVTPLSGPPLTIVPLNNSTNVSIPAGSQAAFGFTVTSSSALLGGINFTCSGLPSGAACSFDKQGETQPQTHVTMTITTTARAKTSVPAAMNSGGTAPLYAALLLPFFSLVQLSLVQLRGRGRKSKSFRPRIAMLLGAFVLLLALVGCGGRQGAPGATYPISVIATSSTTPSVQAVTTVNLTVQ